MSSTSVSAYTNDDKAELWVSNSVGYLKEDDNQPVESPIGSLSGPILAVANNNQPTIYEVQNRSPIDPRELERKVKESSSSSTVPTLIPTSP